MKKAHVSPWDNFEDPLLFLNLAIQCLRSKEINRATKMEALRLLESLRIDIQARQV